MESVTASRSPKWPDFEREYLHAHSLCLICGKPHPRLNLHHKYPVVYIRGVGRPDLECDARNAKYPLCAESGDNHHLLIGHLNYFQSYNPWIDAAIEKCKGLTAQQIASLPEWQTAVKIRPKPFSVMSDYERLQLRRQIDAEMPCLKVSGSYPHHVN